MRPVQVVSGEIVDKDLPAYGLDDLWNITPDKKCVITWICHVSFSQIGLTRVHTIVWICFRHEHSKIAWICLKSPFSITNWAHKSAHCTTCKDWHTLSQIAGKNDPTQPICLFDLSAFLCSYCMCWHDLEKFTQLIRVLIPFHSFRRIACVGITQIYPTDLFFIPFLSFRRVACVGA